MIEINTLHCKQCFEYVGVKEAVCDSGGFAVKCRLLHLFGRACSGNNLVFPIQSFKTYGFSLAHYCWFRFKAAYVMSADSRRTEAVRVSRNVVKNNVGLRAELETL